ncbi:MAG TPA: MOSC domain-containing protein [Rhizomicrobium sp.]
MKIGYVEAIFRYPIKSMRGEALPSAQLGWHGLDGDRRLAFRRLDNHSGFPWLSATTVPELLLFTSERGENVREELPAHVRTPDGEELPIFGEELAAEVGRRYGGPVQMMQLKHGIFDDAAISVIATDTVDEICRRAECAPDVRRFRPNILVRLLRPGAFQENAWLGGTLTFGNGDDAPAVAVTMHDIRCAMINFDPDTAASNPNVLKAAVRANDNKAGIYATVIRTGHIAVGQTLTFRAAA